MANALKSVAVNEIDNAADETIYTVPALTQFTVGVISIANTTNAAKTIRLYRVPSAGAAAQANAILFDFSIPANDFIEFGRGRQWLAGDIIKARASAATSLNIEIAGIETA